MRKQYIKIGIRSKECLVCGKTFDYIRSKAKYCSIKCRNKTYNRSDIVLGFRRKSVENTLLHVTWGAKSRAKRRGIECDITDQYMLELLKKQEGRCAMTGIIMEVSAPNTYKDRKPYVISIDRIDSSRGYTKDNVQLVCSIFNCCKNCYKIEDVTNMCKKYLQYNNISLDE